MVRIREQDNENSVTISVFSANSQNEVINASDNVDLLSAKLARDWAIKTDGKVDGEDYSAKYYALQYAQSVDSLTDTVNGLSTLTEDLEDDIEEIVSDISDINTLLSGFGDIVTHDVSEFATSAQGTLADTALQPNDNVSDLVNDAGYITNSALSGYQTTSNLVTSVSASSTDAEYPSAKLFYDTCGDIETLINAL